MAVRPSTSTMADPSIVTLYLASWMR